MQEDEDVATKATDVLALGKIRLGNQTCPKPCAGSVFLGLPVSRQHVHGDAEDVLEHP